MREITEGGFTLPMLSSCEPRFRVLSGSDAEWTSSPQTFWLSLIEPLIAYGPAFAYILRCSLLGASLLAPLSMTLASRDLSTPSTLSSPNIKEKVMTNYPRMLNENQTLLLS